MLLEFSIPSVPGIVFVCSNLEKWVGNGAPYKAYPEVHAGRSENRFMFLGFLFINSFLPSFLPFLCFVLCIQMRQISALNEQTHREFR